MCAFKGRAPNLTAAAKALITVQAERELWSSCLFGLQFMLSAAVHCVGNHSQSQSFAVV